MVERVARPASLEMTGNRRTGEIKIADAVENLVAHELVLVAQAFLVEDLVALHDHGIVQAAAAGEPHTAQLVDLFGEAAGSRPADLAFAGAFDQLDVTVLLADRLPDRKSHRINS